jgi:hypothetical protein
MVTVSTDGSTKVNRERHQLLVLKQQILEQQNCRENRRDHAHLSPSTIVKNEII